jgi:hypothetical protein
MYRVFWTLALFSWFSNGSILPYKFQCVNVLEDVFEDGVIYDSSGIGDPSESVHAEADNEETGLKQMKIVLPLGSFINDVILLSQEYLPLDSPKDT